MRSSLRLLSSGAGFDSSGNVRSASRTMAFEHGFRADLVVEDRVIVEVKSIERLSPVHPKQLLTYLRLTNLRIGLLLNFGAPMMRDGIKRVVNDLPRLRVNHGH